MKSRVDEVIMRHDKGFNCAQSVACTYCDLVGSDEQTVLRMVEGLGRGIGNMAGTCGAVTGAAVIAGLKYADGNVEAPVSKGKTYDISGEMVDRFLASNGSIVCRELKGMDTGTPLKPCSEYMREAAAIVENFILADLFVENN